jgi:3-dehydroquinate dehydratase/shikimate dehydrogenase
VTLVCVPILAEAVDAALADAVEAKLAGADLVEFRVDHLFHGEGDDAGAEAVARLCDGSPLPCIITCRAASEGGGYDGDDAGRVALWEHLGAASGTRLSPKHPPRYIDVELATLQRSANLRQKVGLAVEHDAQPRDLTTSLILSVHDFHSRPPNLTRLVSEMSAAPEARVNKIAWRARSLRDNLEAFEILQHRVRPTIALCMGEFGLMSRVLASKFGGFLTFASLRDASATAPGQPTIRELLDLYRLRSIRPSTRVYGVIGWPVAHSRSPHLHNAGFAALGHDGVYLPLPVPPEWEHFKATLHSLLDFAPLDFRGASVTIPHKEHLVRFAREDRSRRWTLDPIADRSGSANTIVLDDEGAGRVLNTDGPGAVAALRAHRPGPLDGARVTLLGAGGVARAIAAALLLEGAAVTIRGRNRARADRAVADLTGRGPWSGSIATDDWTARLPHDSQVLMNCTPIGMEGGPDPAGSSLSFMDLRASPKDLIVMDTVYTPVQTPLLRLARAAGGRGIDGRAMFLAQASRQFEAWTGRPAPDDVFRRALDETLSRERS